MELHHKTEMVKTIAALISDGKLAGKKVFSFGHCNATEEMINCLLENGVAVTAILDNNKNKQGSTYRGIAVVPPESIQQFVDSQAVVLIASRFFGAMSTQLRTLGFSGEILKVTDYNTFAEYSLSEDTLRSKTERMLRGSQMLNTIYDHYPEHHLVICPFNALGDVYWALAFLPAYLEKHGIERTLAIVSGNGGRQVAEMFGIPDLVVLDQTRIDELVQAVIFTRRSNCIIAHHDRPYTDNIIKYLNKHFLSFEDYYKYAVYGLNKDTRPVFPAALAEFDEKAGIAKGRTVIVSPYAKSVPQPPSEFWSNLVSEYKRQGFQVVTNVFGDEKPIVKTEPIKIPLPSLVRAAEYAGHFVGLRSGLCDIVSPANCRKTVILPDCPYSTTPFKTGDFFGIPGWEKILYHFT